MKKNTFGKCNHGCPPQPSCDIAHTLRSECVVEELNPTENAKIPIILQEVSMQVLVEAIMDLPVPAREIKVIKKNVELTQCRVIPSFGSSTIVKLFIDGVVHKNIQFVESCSGFIRHHTVAVPFSCFSPVTVLFSVPQRQSIKTGVVETIDIAPNGLGANPCEHSPITVEAFNEPIRCELIDAFVNELDLLQDFDSFGRFNEIKEKMEVVLRVKLLQERQVTIPALVVSALSSATEITNLFKIQNTQ